MTDNLILLIFFKREHHLYDFGQFELKEICVMALTMFFPGGCSMCI